MKPLLIPYQAKQKIGGEKRREMGWEKSTKNRVSLGSLTERNRHPGREPPYRGWKKHKGTIDRDVRPGGPKRINAILV